MRHETNQFWFQVTLFGLLLIFINFESFAISSNAPNVWLSEYGYAFLSSELKTGTSVSFPADKEFQTKDNFTNQHLNKTGNLYVALENTTTVAFVCEADEPVFWKLTKTVHHFKTNLGYNYVVINVRRLEKDLQKNEKAYKSTLYFEAEYDYDDDFLDTFFYATTLPITTFTCETSDQETGGIIQFAKEKTKKSNAINEIHLKPQDKIRLAFVSPNHKPVMNNVTLNLDYCYYNFPVSYVNGLTNILVSNETITFNYEDSKEAQILLEYTEGNNIKEGDKLQVFCYTLHKFYAYGGYVQLHWNNGTSKMLPVIDTDDKGIEVVLSTKNLTNHPVFGNPKILEDLIHFELLFLLTESFEATKDMKSVDCVFPLWNNYGHDSENVTKELNVATT